MIYIYEYRKLGPVDDYYIKRDGEVTKLNNLTQVIELLGTAAFLHKTIECTEYPPDITIWTIS